MSILDDSIVPSHQQMRDWCRSNGVDYHAPFFPYVFQAIADWQNGRFPEHKEEKPNADGREWRIPPQSRISQDAL